MTVDLPDPLKQTRVRALLEAALDLPPNARGEFIEATLEPGATRDEVLELVREVEGLDGFLETPAFPGLARYSPSLPERIAGFRILRVLGWGSMGVVYLARQSAPPRDVALKVLRQDCVSPAARQRFERECELLARLAHPGIASILEAGSADLGAGDQPWFAMEFVDGVALAAYAAREQLDRRGRVQLILQAARAVEHAHARGVVHRDLKPENVFVRRDGAVCVLDFGVATGTLGEASFLTLTATGHIVGTLAYMAPEQARGGAVDARADQYALGAMLYELLTGQLPIAVRGRLPHEVLRLVADGIWTPPSRIDPSLSGDLEAVLAGALAPEPNRRYASVGAFAEDLERWLADLPVHARPPSRIGQFVRLVRRNALVAAGIALTLLMLGSLLMYAAERTFERERESAVAQLLSDRTRLTELQELATELWPTASATIPGFDRWLRSARQLAARLPRHMALLEEIGAADSEFTSSVGREAGDDWLSRQCQELVADIESFAAEDGLLAQVSARQAQAASLRARTVQAMADAWREAAARVRDDARFAGLELTPQEGLVPLGPDPESGLEEFALDGTGALPERGLDPCGRVRPRVGDALTLVLVPGGETWIGMQTTRPERPDEPGYTAGVRWYAAHLGPPFRVRLDPFLISKFEVTQDQFSRWFGANPSDWEVGSAFFGNLISALHPVETVNWKSAQELLPRVGVTLPTEAQWERAALGDSPFPYLGGPSHLDAVGFANWNTHNRQDIDPSLAAPNDGYFTHRPVGDLAANGFGLHDVLGNVWELCLDVYKVDYHVLPHRPGDGLVVAEPDGDVSRRGCGSGMMPWTVHALNRGDKRFDSGDALTGLRPARALRGSD
ncbi:MAG: bifunctional serine/threonine-protein kinase/formylglycine-generating enzyme family protein [Planctomycetota bacterium]